MITVLVDVCRGRHPWLQCNVCRVKDAWSGTGLKVQRWRRQETHSVIKRTTSTVARNRERR
ncbi:hypothetical protein E2C01_005472 [Portunus trituberculatus]|uniref:Uncharacterized protein n=1 Tax=Portunus trituberculatus TaxID=210409 RepID=A0A5B7CVM2_PORTR|nr:hypothetical protein [Portunus trituberculatus]